MRRLSFLLFLLCPLWLCAQRQLSYQLQVQADGLGGHLDETWPDVGPDSGWLGGKGESWERGPYFIDGLLPLAWQLGERGNELPRRLDLLDQVASVVEALQ